MAMMMFSMLILQQIEQLLSGIVLWFSLHARLAQAWVCYGTYILNLPVASTLTAMLFAEPVVAIIAAGNRWLMAIRMLALMHVSRSGSEHRL